MIVLDTNVISELMKKPADAAVAKWFVAHEAQTVLPVPALAEIAFGIARLPIGTRRLDLEAKFADWRVRYSDRSFPFTASTAMLYGAIMAGALSAKHNMAVIDGQIAAMVVEQDAVLATRNTKDFTRASIKLVNPWD